MHRITSKRQILIQNNVQFDGTLNAGYDLTYTYGTDTGKKFQLANVKDVNYRTEETPSESENVNNSHAYEYDANGNLVYVNTSRTKKDGMADEKTAERKLKWDEENRLLASDDNGFVTNYWYDADGERTVKTSGESDQVYVNSEFAGGRTNTAKFSLYVSPYLVANQGGRYTKHIYIGSQRVVSKIGDFDSYGSDPRRIQYADSETDGLSVDYKQKVHQSRYQHTGCGVDLSRKSRSHQSWKRHADYLYRYAWCNVRLGWQRDKEIHRVRTWRCSCDLLQTLSSHRLGHSRQTFSPCAHHQHHTNSWSQSRYHQKQGDGSPHPI